MDLVHQFLAFALAFVQCFFTLSGKSTEFATVENLEACLFSRGISKPKLYSQSNLKYLSLNYQCNALPDTVYPMCYFLPENSRDIQAFVNCCRQLKIRLVVKGGGHSYEKYSFGDNSSVVVDLQTMDSIKVDPESKTATVGPGVLLGKFEFTLIENGFISTHGECPTVGISGYALGGGHGYFVRYYGMLSDNIVEADVITADGSFLQVNKQSYPDLFWAIRGAGASFGIVSNFRFKIYKLPRRIIWGTKYWPRSDFIKVFSAYQELIASNLKNSLNIVLIVQETVKVDFFELQRRRKRSVIRNLIKRFPTTTTNEESVESLSYQRFLQAITYSKFPKLGNLTDAGYKTLTRLSFTKQKSKDKSFYMQRFMTVEEIRKIYTLLKEIPLSLRSNVRFEVKMYGGAINNLLPTDTAFVHRGDVKYLVAAWYLRYDNHDHELTKVDQFVLNWLNKFYDVTKSMLHHTQSYQNYVNGDMPDALQRYYGVNLRRLRKLKKKYDPTNFFNNPQSIPVF